MPCEDKNTAPQPSVARLGVITQSKRWPVQFPVRARAEVSGSVPGRAPMRGNQLMFLSHIDVSLPLFFPSFPSL